MQITKASPHAGRESWPLMNTSKHTIRHRLSGSVEISGKDPKGQRWTVRLRTDEVAAIRAGHNVPDA